MPPTNYRSSSTHPSRRTHTIQHSHGSRSTSAPAHRDFIIIVTNNPELIPQTLRFQPQVREQMQASIPVQNNTNHYGTINNNNNNYREQTLNNLLRVELREVTHNYLTRTRRSFPIHYVFNMSDIDLSTPPQGYEQKKTFV